MQGARHVRVRRRNADGACLDLERLRVGDRRRRIRLHAGHDILDVRLKLSRGRACLPLVLDLNQRPRALPTLVRLALRPTLDMLAELIF